jgi:putative ABC transport system permease protein
MYPNLTMPLLLLLAVAAAALGFVCLRRPALRWLALRQVSRRRAEALLVIGGSMLGTAIIVGSLVVGDTLGFSVRQVAYRTLGPIDERVVSTTPAVGNQVADRLQAGLAGSPDVDGVLSARVAQGAATSIVRAVIVAEPRVLVWDLDFGQAARFGSAGGPSGISGPAPALGEVVVNEPFARALRVRAGDDVTLYLDGVPNSYRVARILPVRGVAGAGPSTSSNNNAFVHPGSLSTTTSHTASVTWVSNRGGVQTGNALTGAVKARINRLLGPLTQFAMVDAPKHDVLLAAQKTGDSLGSLFLMIGSFSIIAGALLLVNIFVMLAEERKGQLGMLRAAGLKRSALVGAFTLEGAVYAVVATAVGTALGVAVGRGVAFIAARIFSSWSQDGSGLDVTFAVTPTSLVNGAALGLVIALATIAATSIRISRFNIIAAIRDLDTPPAARGARRRLVIATSAAAVFGLLAVRAVVASDAIGTFVLPALTAVCLIPLLRGRFGRRRAYTAVSAAVLAWTLLANIARPKIYDNPSMSVFVVLGTLVAFSAVALVTENQSVLLRPFRPVMRRPSEDALATRLAVAYPLAKPFRTGATLIMYTLIFLVLLLLSEISGVINKSIDSQIASSTGGYGLRADFNPVTMRVGAADRIRRALPPGSVVDVAPLLSAEARAVDPGHRTSDPIETLAIGVQGTALTTMQFDKRIAGLDTDTQVWQLVAANPRYVVLDGAFAAEGGPPGSFYAPGDPFILTDPRTGKTEQKIIAGILKQSTVFYSPAHPASFPVVESDAAVREQFGDQVEVASALVQLRPGVDVQAAAARLQAALLRDSLVATPMAARIRHLFDANIAFFRLMQGFLALGLLVGICGLGVVMVRAVRERRRTIGILRALGFRARTIERSFLLESGFIAFEGVVIGSVLGILTTWLMYEKSAMFTGIRTGFPIMWGTASVLAAITLVASLLATYGPARRAAHILPALATRVSE